MWIWYPLIRLSVYPLCLICSFDIVPGKQRFDISASDLIDRSGLIYFLIYFRQKHIRSIELVTVMNINASNDLFETPQVSYIIYGGNDLERGFNTC